jgi:hypothetical protein
MMVRCDDAFLSPRTDWMSLRIMISLRLLEMQLLRREDGQLDCRGATVE